MPQKLFIKGPKHGLKIAAIPDCQVKPGVPTDHLVSCGKYLAEKRPDVILVGGDFADMPSLSLHDTPGSLPLEGKRYLNDIDSAKRAMDGFMSPIRQANGYNPKLILLYGNHEDRITRAIKREPKLEGFMSLDDLCYRDFGFTVYPFLQSVSINDVVFNHYFPSGIMGRPITSAKALLTKLHKSAFAFHQQGRDIAYSVSADGTGLTAIISGSFYQHDEDYLSPFTNQHWRGMYMLHEVKNGSFDEMAISINFLKRRYGKKI